MHGTTVPVSVSRFIDAPPQRIFDAFLIPENAARCLFATRAGKIVRAEIDARVGGKFLFTDRRDGEDVDHFGEYLALVPGRRIVFSYTVPKRSNETSTVRVEILPCGKGSKVALTHEGVPPEASARTTEGWMQILCRLAKETTNA